MCNKLSSYSEIGNILQTNNYTFTLSTTHTEPLSTKALRSYRWEQACGTAGPDYNYGQKCTLQARPVTCNCACPGGFHLTATKYKYLYNLFFLKLYFTQQQMFFPSHRWLPSTSKPPQARAQNPFSPFPLTCQPNATESECACGPTSPFPSLLLFKRCL